MNNIQAFKATVNTALQQLRLKKAEIRSKVTDEYDKINYSQILIELSNIERYLIRSQRIERFLKSTQDSIERTNTLTIEHTVKQYETPLMIARKYSVDISEILRMNNITSDQMTAGVKIKIEVPFTQSQVNADLIPVYGDVSGSNILGKDFVNPLKPNNKGDVSAYDPINTVRETVGNRITTKTGEYPLYPDFGLSGIVGEELEQEIANALLAVKITEALEKDPRISVVTDVSFSEDRANITAKTIDNKIVNV